MGREGAWADVEESRPLVVLDVEASGLPPGTFPIEIGITYIETGRTRSWLIRPDPQWRSWPWDLAAEHLHGISRHTLEVDGLDALQVYSELLAAVDGHEVLADAPADEWWLTVLARSAGAETLAFRIWSVWKVVEMLAGHDDAVIAQALGNAENANPHCHRAGPDAARWAHVIRSLAGLEPDGTVLDRPCPPLGPED